ELKAVHAGLGIALGHLLMNNPAPGGHPLHVAGADRAAVAHAVAMFDFAGEDIGDRLDAAMRMPRKARQIVFGFLISEIVEEQEWIGLSGIAKAKRAAEMHASAF